MGEADQEKTCQKLGGVQRGPLHTELSGHLISTDSSFLLSRQRDVPSF